jgi:hypothetical protein
MAMQKLAVVSVVLTLALVSGCGIAEKWQAKKRLEASCLVAEDILSITPSYYKMPIVYSDVKLNPKSETAGWDSQQLVATWPIGPISRIKIGHMQSFAVSTPSSAMVACPNVVRMAKSLGRAYGSEAVGRATQGGQNGDINTTFKAQITSFSLPYLSEDGRDALFLYNMVAAGLDGHGLLILARKNSAGKWEILDTMQLWIS